MPYFKVTHGTMPPLQNLITNKNERSLYYISFSPFATHKGVYFNYYSIGLIPFNVGVTGIIFP